MAAIMSAHRDGPEFRKSAPASDRMTTKLSTPEKTHLRIIDDFSKSVDESLPESPFILTVPSSAPFEHFSRYQAEVGWRMHNLFDRDEEHMQYTSFFYREHGISTFVCRTEVDEERDRRKKLGAHKGKEAPKQTAQSSLTVAKKKISLSDYKLGKISNRGTTTTSKPTSLKNSNGTNPHTPQPVSDPKLGSSIISSPGKSDAQIGQKRNITDSVDPSTSSADSKGSSVQQVKKAKLPTSASLQTKRLSQNAVSPVSSNMAGKPRPDTKKNLGSTSAPHGLPPPLSPIRSTPTPHGLPPPLSPIKKITPPYGLPPILSPTLPAIIQKELDRIERLEKLEKLDKPDGRARMDSPGSNYSGSEGDTIHVSNPKQKKDTSAPATAPAPVQGTTDQVSTTKGLDRPRQTASSAQPTAPQEALHNKKAPVTNDTSLVITLRFSKRNRLNLERILRLPQRSPSLQPERKRMGGKKLAAAEEVKKADKTKDTIANLTKTDSPQQHDKKRTTVSGKRPRPVDDAPAPVAKRPRASTTEDGVDRKPRTPNQQQPTSPSRSNKSSAQKVQYLTPGKESVRPLSMARTLSADGQGSTPGFSGATPSSQRERSGLTAVPGGKQVQEWSERSKRYNDMGRLLKHEAERIARSSANPTLSERRRSAVMSMECILSYMAAYTCMDIFNHHRGRPYEVDSNWRSLLPLWASFKARCQEFPHLEGFRLHLGSIISARVVSLLSLQARQRPADSPQIDPAAEIRLLADSFKNSQRYASNARMRLSVTTIMDEYPRTWAQRCTDQEPKEWEQLQPGRLKGPYFLPFGVDTTPAHAVRAGVEFLQEWMRSVKLQYEMQLILL